MYCICVPYAYIGLDLFSVYLARKEEGAALRLLHECYYIDLEVDVTQKIALLEKKTDLLLHIYDTLEQTIVEIEKSSDSNKKSTDIVLVKLHIPTVRNIPTVRTIMNPRILSMIETVEWLGSERASIESVGAGEIGAGDSAEGGSESLAVGMVEWDETNSSSNNSSSSCSHLPDAVVEEVHTQHTTQSPATTSTTETTLSGDHTAPIPPVEAPHTQNMITNTTATATTSKSFVQFAEPIVQLEENQVLLEESNTAIARIHTIHNIVLQEATLLSEESIAIHREEYQNDLVEPSTLAIAYIQRARVAERVGEGVVAMEYTELGEIAAVRALGGGSQLAIAIMLEVSVCLGVVLYWLLYNTYSSAVLVLSIIYYIYCES